MQRKIIAILTIGCIIASFNLTGCGKNSNQNSKEEAKTETVTTVEEKQEKPEEVIEKMYKGLIDKKLTYENIWDDYFSETSKNIEMYKKDKYVSSAKEDDFKNNIVRTDIMAVSSEEIKENIFKVKCIIKYTENGKEMNPDSYEYVIKENNKFKYLPCGILSVEKHSDTTIENITYKNMNLINYVEGIGFSFDLVNQSENAISLGWVDGPTFTLKTDKGEYSGTLDPKKIAKGQSQTINLNFNNAEGTLQEITVNNINYLDNRGLPKDHTGGQTQTIAIK